MRQYKLLLQDFLTDRLKTFRLNKELSQEQMAELLHISPRSYIDLEHGKNGFSATSLIFFQLSLPRSEVLRLLDDFWKLVERKEQDDLAFNREKTG